MINPISSLREEREEGFTLIELLVVTLIIGILAAIAIPAFLNQRKSAVDSTVQTDLSNAGTVLSLQALAGKTVKSAVTITDSGPSDNASTDAGSMNLADIQVSDGNTLTIQPSMVEGGLCIYGFNPGGDESAKAPGMVYDSLAGGLLKEGSTSVSCGSGEDASEDTTVTSPGIVEGILFRFSGKVFDPNNKCYLKNSDYVITGYLDVAGAPSWKIDGLEDLDYHYFEALLRITGSADDSFMIGGEPGYHMPELWIDYNNDTKFSFAGEDGNIQFYNDDYSVHTQYLLGPADGDKDISKSVECG